MGAIRRPGGEQRHALYAGQLREQSGIRFQLRLYEKLLQRCLEYDQHAGLCLFALQGQSLGEGDEYGWVLVLADVHEYVYPVETAQMVLRPLLFPGHALSGYRYPIRGLPTFVGRPTETDCRMELYGQDAGSSEPRNFEGHDRNRFAAFV